MMIYVFHFRVLADLAVTSWNSYKVLFTVQPVLLFKHVPHVHLLDLPLAYVLRYELSLMKLFLHFVQTQTGIPL